ILIELRARFSHELVQVLELFSASAELGGGRRLDAGRFVHNVLPEMLDCFALASRVPCPALPRHPENCYGWYQREASNIPGFNRGERAMKRSVLAALGLSLFGTGAANAQSMSLTSTDLKEGATIANDQVFKGFGCTGSNVSPALS